MKRTMSQICFAGGRGQVLVKKRVMLLFNAKFYIKKVVGKEGKGSEIGLSHQC